MRAVLVLFALGMVILPALLTLWSSGKSRGRRIVEALTIVLVPAAIIGAMQGVPELDGRALDHPSLWTSLRLALTGLALILPWCLHLWFRRPR